MTSQATAGFGTGRPRRRTTATRVIFWLATAVGLPPLTLVALIYLQHVAYASQWLFSGEISSRPDVQEALVSSAVWSAIHVAAIGLWLALGLHVYRKGRRKQPAP